MSTVFYTPVEYITILCFIADEFDVHEYVSWAINRYRVLAATPGTVAKDGISSQEDFLYSCDQHIK